MTLRSISELEDILRQIASHARHLDKVSKGLTSATSVSSHNPVAVWKLLREAFQLMSTNGTLRQRIETILPQVENAAFKVILELEADIRQLSQDRQWRIDGQWPVLYFERGIEVRFDDKRQELIIAGKRTPDLQRNAVARALGDLVDRLIPPGFSGERFMLSLARSYDQLTAGIGGQTRILQLYRAMVIETQSEAFWWDARTDKYAELTISQFRARLSHSLGQRGGTLPDGRLIRLFAPITPDDGLFMYQPAESRFGFVGRVELLHREEVTSK